MSNLGSYQRIVVVSKQLGGPKRFVAAVFAAGAATGLSGGLGGMKAAKLGKAALGKQKDKKAAKAAVGERDDRGATTAQQFTVTADGVDSAAGLAVRSGDSFLVLARDGDAILIEVLGHQDNPYMVSAHFLATISGFPPDSTPPDA